MIFVQLLTVEANFRLSFQSVQFGHSFLLVCVEINGIQ